MTAIIYEQNGVSIQVYNIARADTATGVSRIVAQTLLRAGRFLGASVTMDIVDDVATAPVAYCRNVDNSELTYGQVIDVIEIIMKQNSGVNKFIGSHVVVYIGI